ncbi:hypothetical protein JZ785_23975 [Alicyclobacillus curvatus]|nr:hypothetical protein JZ785_23975 [Alicyclobacillus curvatus]
MSMTAVTDGREFRSERNAVHSRSLEFIPVNYLVALRFILGFQFLSAFARRYINAPVKMDPSSSAFLGHKFSEFAPHAIWPVKPILLAIIQHTGVTFGFLTFFSFVELLVGIFLITGTLTRLAAFGAAILSLMILFGSGWMGTSCVDEWQIGTVEGIAAMVFMFTGSGRWGVDHLLRRYWDGTLKIGRLHIPLM